MITRGDGFAASDNGEEKGRKMGMFRKIAGLACAMALLLALFTLPAARTALAGDNDAAKIGDKTYETLEAAFADVPDGTPTTITLLRNASGNGIQVAGTKNITFDLGGFTYTIDGDAVGSSGTETNGFQLLKGATVKFQNGTITSTKAKILIQNYCDLTLQNVLLDGTQLNYAAPYTLSLNCGKIQITGNTSILAKSGGVAFDLYYWATNGYTEGVQVTVDTTGTISGPIELTTDSSGAETAAQYNKLVIQNVRHEGTITNGLGEYDTKVASISGGVFSETPLRYTGDTVVSTGGDFYVGKQANEVMQNPATKEVTVLQAKGALTAGDGVKVINGTGGAITVNGKEVAANGQLEDEDAPVPETGDGEHLLLWFVLATVAAGGLLYSGLRKRCN